MDIFRLLPIDLRCVCVHPKQKRHQSLIDTLSIKPLLDGWWGAFEGGHLLVFGSLASVADGIGVWLLFTDQFKPRHMLSTFTSLRAFLDEWCADAVRVYMDVDPDYPEACRLARILGFSTVGSIDMPDGRTLTRMWAAYA